MRALPARRIAFGAMCAVLLVAITGPAALAADSARERGQVAPPGAPLVQVRNLDVSGGELAPVADLLTAVTRAGDGRLPAAEARTLGEAAKEALKKAEARQQAARAVPFASAPAPGVLLPTAETDPMSDALDALWDAVDRLLDLLLPGDDTSDATDDATDEEATDEIADEIAETTDEITDEIDEILAGAGAGAGVEAGTGDEADPALSLLDDLLTEVEKLLDELPGGHLQVSVVTTQTTPSTTTSSSVTSSSITLLTPSPSVPATASPVVTLPATTSPAPTVVLSAD
ncbi:hypothetical protein [Streptomyces sp. TE5632]